MIHNEQQITNTEAASSSNNAGIISRFSSLGSFFTLLFLSIALITGLTLVIGASYLLRAHYNELEKTYWEVLRSRTKYELALITQKEEDRIDRILENMFNQAYSLSSNLNYAYLLQQNFNFIEESDYKLIQMTEGQFTNIDQTKSSLFVPSLNILDDATLRDIQFSAILDQLVPNYISDNPEFSAVFFATLKKVYRSYPPANLVNIFPPDYDPTQSSWFKGSLSSLNDQHGYIEVRDQNKVFGAPVVTISVPVITKEKLFLGVVGIDIPLEILVSKDSTMQDVKTASFFLIDSNGTLVYLADQVNQDILNLANRNNESKPTLTNVQEPFNNIFKKMMSGENGFAEITINDNPLFVSYMPLESVNWSLGIAVDQNSFADVIDIEPIPVNQQTFIVYIQRLVLIWILLIAVMLIVGGVVIFRTLEPVSHLVNTLILWSGGDFDAQIPKDAPLEFGLVATLVQNIKTDLRNQIYQLDKKISEKSAILDQQTRQIQIASEVARDIISTRNFHVLLDRTLNLLIDRLKYYHVGIFLIDPNREYAILEAAPGEIGSAMIEQGHRLRLGSSSIVGSVSSLGEALVVNDSTKEPLFIKNPLLPHAMSELALPLMVDGNVIGVLDVYQNTIEAFDREECEILQTLADQLAFAIANARLYQQYQDTERQLEKLSNQLSLDIWQSISETSPIAGYAIDSAGINAFGWNDKIQNQEESFKLPIQVRGIITAWLEIWPLNGNLSVSEAELLSVLSDRIGQAIESARLFEETIKRASREQMVNKIVTSLSGTLELDRLLQDAVRELGLLPNIAEVVIQVNNVEKGKIDQS